MTPLVSAEEIRQRLGLMDDPSVLMTLQKVASACQSLVETHLSTPLTEQTHVDVFELDSSTHSGITVGGVFRCMLKAAFVKGVPSLELATRWNGPWTALDASQSHLDTIKGLLFVDNAHAGRFLRVTYTAGFSKSADLPNPLAEAIIGWSSTVLAQSTTTTEGKEFSKAYRDSVELSMKILTPYLRNKGFCLQPMFP